MYTLWYNSHFAVHALRLCLEAAAAAVLVWLWSVLLGNRLVGGFASNENDRDIGYAVGLGQRQIGFVSVGVGNHLLGNLNLDWGMNVSGIELGLRELSCPKRCQKSSPREFGVGNESALD
jgi:hypothetical protein